VGSSRKRIIFSAVFVAYTLIAGGLWRLFAELALRAIPSGFNWTNAVPPLIGTCLIIVVSVLVLYRWPPYRRLLTRNGPPIPSRARWRLIRYGAVAAAAPIVVALVLPGPVAAAIAIVSGVVLRVAATMVIAAADLRS
jgi:hypothetical protein